MWCGSLAVLALAGTSGSYWFVKSAPAEVLATGAAPVAGPQGLVCFGYVDVENGVTSLYPLQPGRVAEVPVRENDAVAAGAILLRLDDRQARLRVHEAQAALDAAQEQLAEMRKLPQQQRTRIAQQEAAVEAMQQRLSAARHQLQRKQEMERAKLLNHQEVAIAADQVREVMAGERAEIEKLNELKLRDPLAAVRRAEKEAALYQARLEQAQQALEECTLRAPRPGKVIRILVGVGDVLSGQPQQPALVICPDGPRLVRAEVEQEFAGRVALHQLVQVEDDVISGAHWTGKVVRIADGYQQRRPILHDPARYNDVRTLECLVALDGGQAPVRLGQRVRVLIGAAGW
jgi:multidrug resistance efflux pump